MIQDCTFSSPDDGPLRGDAPSWCLAPFEPEGLLRFDTFETWKTKGDLKELDWFCLLLLVFSSVSAVFSGTIGIHYGHVLIHFKVQNSVWFSWRYEFALIVVKSGEEIDGFVSFLQAHSQRLKQWVAMGFGCFVIGIILHFTNGLISWSYLL